MVKEFIARINPCTGKETHFQTFKVNMSFNFHTGAEDGTKYFEGKSLGFCGTILDVENFLKGG